MKHKHADLIKAWADGAEIQVFHPNTDTWDDCTYDPTWNRRLIYRIKPEPKPDDVMYAYLLKIGTECVIKTQAPVCNVKFIWDSETGELKLAEVIK